MNYRSGGISALPRKTTLGGQDHLLSYITPQEARMLREQGGGVTPTGGQYRGPGGLPAFFVGPGAPSAAAAAAAAGSPGGSGAPGGAGHGQGSVIGGFAPSSDGGGGGGGGGGVPGDTDSPDTQAEVAAFSPTFSSVPGDTDSPETQAEVAEFSANKDAEQSRKALDDNNVNDLFSLRSQFDPRSKAYADITAQINVALSKAKSQGYVPGKISKANMVSQMAKALGESETGHIPGFVNSKTGDTFSISDVANMDSTTFSLFSKNPNISPIGDPKSALGFAVTNLSSLALPTPISLPFSVISAVTNPDPVTGFLSIPGVKSGLSDIGDATGLSNVFSGLSNVAGDVATGFSDAVSSFGQDTGLSNVAAGFSDAVGAAASDVGAAASDVGAAVQGLSSSSPSTPPAVSPPGVGIPEIAFSPPPPLSEIIDIPTPLEQGPEEIVEDKAPYYTPEQLAEYFGANSNNILEQGQLMPTFAKGGIAMLNPQQETGPKYSGEPTAQSLANGLATLGRYGDSYMVHAADGETVVPGEVLAANPGLKQDLFRQMTMMGIKNPNRYVVGHELNSINPITGQPEFFFKKVWKAVKKVAKKVLPIAAPIIGNMIAPGIGGIIASGLTTKLMGGSWGDALKSAALSYGIGALGQGVMGGITSVSNPVTGFMTGLGRGLSAPFSAAGNLFSAGAANPFSQGIFGSSGAANAPGATWFDKVMPRYDAQAQSYGPVGTDVSSSTAISGGPSQQVAPLRGEDANFARFRQPDSLVGQQAETFTTLEGPDEFGVSKVQDPTGEKAYQSTISTAGKDDLATTALSSGKGSKVITLPDGRTYVENPDGTFGAYLPRDTPVQAGQAAAETSWLRENLGETLGGAAETLVLPAALAGAAYFLTPEQETVAEQVQLLDELNPRRKAYDNWEKLSNEEKDSEQGQDLFTEWYGKPRYTQEELQKFYGADPGTGINPGASQVVSSPVPITTAGGIPNLLSPVPTEVSQMIDPHRLTMAAGGGEVMGPGTGTSDSIPARLSDGEFVMTAQAVRNAGGGNRALGAARMYDMMNRFERGAA